MNAFSEHPYPDAFAKAAVYAYSISENQPFLDGNKRSAAAAMGTFLLAHKNELTCSEMELYKTMIRLTNKEIMRDGLAKWLRRNSKKKR